MRHHPYSQCVQVRRGTLLIAVADGRCWLNRVASTAITPLPVSSLAAQRSTSAASLVEGAISAGLAEAVPTPTTERYTLPRYIRWLVGNYVFAAQTPGLFRRGAARLDTLQRSDLACFARRKADEETGHADLARRDLESLGLPVAEAVRLLEPPSAQAFADRFRDCVESDHPVALFGFSYCLERMAIERDRAFVERIRALYPPDLRAHRFLKVHSAIGSDRSHVFEQLEMFESLSTADLTMVASAAHETAGMLARQATLDRTLSDEEIARRLEGAGIGVASHARAGGSRAM